MKKTLAAGSLWALPFLALAQELGNIETLVESIGDIVNLLLPIVIGIALLAFFWGLATYIFNAGNEDAKDKGKRIMIGGIIALFVAVAIWGIIGFIGSALGIDTQEDLGNVPGIEELE